MPDKAPARGMNPGLTKTGDLLLVTSGAVSLAVTILFYLGFHHDIPVFSTIKTGLIELSGAISRRYEVLQAADGRSGDCYLAGFIGFLLMTAMFGTRFFLAHRRECHAKGEHQSFHKLSPKGIFAIFGGGGLIVGAVIFVNPTVFGGSGKVSSGGFFYYPTFMIFGVLAGYMAGLMCISIVGLTLRQFGARWRV